MEIKEFRYLLSAAFLLAALSATAQSDFGIWTSVGAEKKINKKLSVDLEAEMRTRDNSSSIDRWSGEFDATYKLTDWLKATAGYVFLYDRNEEKTTYKRSGKVNNYRPGYWGNRHRVHFDLTSGFDLGNWNISLRERWQYTYRPEVTTTRWDNDNEYWEDTKVEGKAKHVLRSRLQVQYGFKKLEPYGSVELYNGWNLQKVRYTLGTDYTIKKHHKVGIYYRYQTVNDDDEPSRHILGASYKYKF